MSLKDVIEPTSKPYGYQYKEKKEKGYKVISPSGIKNFYSDIKTWKKNVIDNTPTFFGNEATKLGDIVHKFAELYREGKLNQDNTLPKVEVDKLLSTTSDVSKELYQHYPLMNKALLENYLEIYPKEVDSEYYMEFELDEQVLVAGTIDEIDRENRVITDFKTSKNPYKDEKDIATHFMQLCVYCALLEKLESVSIQTIRVVNIARPTKTIGSRVTILECDADIEYGKKIINEVYQATLLCKKHKDVIDSLFKDNPFDGFTNPSKESIEAYVNKHIKNFKIITQEENKVAKIKKNIFA